MPSDVILAFVCTWYELVLTCSPHADNIHTHCFTITNTNTKTDTNTITNTDNITNNDYYK